MIYRKLEQITIGADNCADNRINPKTSGEYQIPFADEAFKLENEQKA